jgi:hypothetical protein
VYKANILLFVFSMRYELSLRGLYQSDSTQEQPILVTGLCLRRGSVATGLLGLCVCVRASVFECFVCVCVVCECVCVWVCECVSVCVVCECVCVWCVCECCVCVSVVCVVCVSVCVWMCE